MISHLYMYGFSQTYTLYKLWMSNCADLGINYRLQYPQLPVPSSVWTPGASRPLLYTTWCPGRLGCSSVESYRQDSPFEMAPGSPENQHTPPTMNSTNISPVCSDTTLTPTPSKRVKATPLGLVINISSSVSSSAKDQYTADLVQIAIFFCLRSCGYIKMQSYCRTTQFYFCSKWGQPQHTPYACTIHIPLPCLPPPPANTSPAPSVW